MSTSQKMSIRDKIKAIIDDPTASDLLRFICAKSLNRDVLDAVYDLELAADLFAQLLLSTGTRPGTAGSPRASGRHDNRRR